MNDLIIDTLKKAVKPMKAGEIADASGMDKKEVDKLIKSLKAADKIYCPKRCFYDIKD